MERGSKKIKKSQIDFKCNDDHAEFHGNLSLGSEIA
jgi:hypothetical protein